MILTAIQSVFWRRNIKPLWVPLMGGVAAGALVILAYNSCWLSIAIGLAICVSVYIGVTAMIAKIRATSITE